MLLWDQGGGEHSPQDSTSAQGWMRTRGCMALGVGHASPRVMGAATGVGTGPVPVGWGPDGIPKSTTGSPQHPSGSPAPRISLGMHSHSTQPWARSYPPSSSSWLMEESESGSAPELHSPTDDLLVLGPDEMLLLRGQDAQGEFLPCPALAIHHIRALVHVDGALWEGGWLRGERKRSNFRREEQRSAELSPKTSRGRHQDSAHHDSLAIGTHIHPWAQQSSVPPIWGHRAAGTTPARPVWPSAASKVLLLCQISREG